MWREGSGPGAEGGQGRGGATRSDRAAARRRGRAYGNLSFRKHARRRDPYIARGLDFPEECYRRLD
jgi:hypothetical protein